jgi:hypothetical protein
VIFGVIIGLFGTLLLQQKLLEAKVDQQLGELREFLVQKQVSKKVSDHVRKYMSVLYRKKTGYNEKVWGLDQGGTVIVPAIGCHSLGMYKVILLPLLSVSVGMAVLPWASETDRSAAPPPHNHRHRRRIGHRAPPNLPLPTGHSLFYLYFGSSP